MNWLVPRILAGVLAMIVGGLVGEIAGRALDAPGWDQTARLLSCCVSR